MAVQSEYQPINYQGNDSTSTPYQIPFPYFDDSWVKVYVDGAALVGGFTLSGDGEAGNGSLTTDVAYTSSQQVTIAREVPETQEYVYPDGSKMHGPVVERNLDTQNFQIQQVSEKTGRSIKFKVGSGSVPEIPRTPDTTLVVDSEGNPAVKTASEMIEHIGVQASVDAAANSATESSESAGSASTSETNASQSLAQIIALVAAIPQATFNFDNLPVTFNFAT